MCSRKITHVIFDLDGLLLGEYSLSLCELSFFFFFFNTLASRADTEILYTNCTQRILDRYGKQFTWDIKQRMMGRKALEAASILLAHTGVPLTPEEFHSELYSTLNSIFPEAKLMTGTYICGGGGGGGKDDGGQGRRV